MPENPDQEASFDGVATGHQLREFTPWDNGVPGVDYAVGDVITGGGRMDRRNRKQFRRLWKPSTPRPARGWRRHVRKMKAKASWKHKTPGEVRADIASMLTALSHG